MMRHLTFSLDASRDKPLLSLRLAILLIVGVITFGTLGFMLIEDYTFNEAFYMTIITISTVGYTEVHTLSTTGRWYASLLIIVNIGVFAYSLAAFTNFIIEGELFRMRSRARMNKKISQTEKHVIICGFGKYGHEIAAIFQQHKVPFVIIENNEERVEELYEELPNELILHGDATQDDIMLFANIKRAKAIIAATGDDSENLYIVLSARQLAPRINIISRAINPRAEKKMRLAGADHVVLPNQIGGYFMANLVTNPIAVDFFQWITNEEVSDVALEEVDYEQLTPELRGKTIKELDFQNKCGARVIAIKRGASNYNVNPSSKYILAQEEAFIFLGVHDAIQKLQGLIN